MNVHHEDLLVLSCIQGVGPARLKALVGHCGGTDGILRSPVSELSRIEGMDRRTAASIVEFAGSPERSRVEQYARNQISRLSRIDGRITSLWDQEYPAHLKNTYAAPPFLFYRGFSGLDTSSSIAIVGTRNPTHYGSKMTGMFTEALVSAGFITVSGLARGIDTIVHERTLQLNGTTIAVIGSGLDVPYPPENVRLAERVAGSGLVISEFPMGTKPDAVNFPRRNRIISGLTMGTVVIETGTKGGAMITASFALEQNREVFAVPGPVNLSRASGTHQLIKEGRAKLTESIDDILAEIRPGRIDARPVAPEVALTLFEQRVYDQIGEDPVHVDVIASTAGLPSKDALVELLHLEFKGVIQQLPGKYFRRT